MCEMPKKKAVSIKLKRRLKFDEKKQGSGIAFAVSSSVHSPPISCCADTLDS